MMSFNHLSFGNPHINCYANMKEVNQGASSKIYVAIHRRSNNHVVIKAIDSIHPLKLFKQEVRLLKKVNCVNVVKCFESFFHERRLMIVLELVDGRDLSRAILHQREHGKLFPEYQIWHILQQTCNGLKSLHGNNILHRDVKPANIIVTKKLQVKIGDLGLGCILDERAIEDDALVGTMFYMAPERTTGEKYGLPSDIWSLGCVLYEMAALRTPFSGEHCNEYALIKRIRACEMIPIPGDKYSEHLHRFVDSCLSRDPADRPTAEEAYKAAKMIDDKFQSFAYPSW